MELVVYLCLGLARWAMLVPFRLLFTTWGIKKRAVASVSASGAPREDS